MTFDILQLIMFIILIPLTFKVVEIIDFESIFKRRAPQLYKQLFYVFLSVITAYIISDAFIFVVRASFSFSR